MADGVTEVKAVRLEIDDAPWLYAAANRAAIAAAWQASAAANPRFFNGTVYVARGPRIAGGVFAASLVRTDFASYLHWRSAGYPGDTEFHSILGAAALISADGRIILARQRSGQLNSGVLSFVGGLIDDRDCRRGRVEIGAQIRREVAEETGLAPQQLKADPGYLVVMAGRVAAVVARVRSPLAGSVLEAEIRTSLAGGTDDELADVFAVSALSELDGVRLAPYARLLVAHLLPASPSGGGQP